VSTEKTIILKRILTISTGMLLVLIAAAVLGISVGSSGGGFETVIRSIFGKTIADSSLEDIIWRIRMPRVVLAALVGAALSSGGLVFQALLRNPLAEPYILGISGGAAIGAISGILAGLSQFPGVSVSSFIGSMMTLALLLMISSGRTILRKETLLLSGVMVNAFCSAVIMFLVSMTQDARIHNIIFWLMGDLSLAGFKQVLLLAAIIIPGVAVLFWLSHVMNLLLLGKETAQSLGVNLKVVTVILLGTTSLMVSATVSQCGLLGFVGLVIPHLLRFVVGPDHRVLVPACVLGGGAYMIVCDVLARTLPRQGEMPAGVVTAIIGAPLFIFLLKKSVR
jgi:iron complex transport system permease protein